MRHCVLAALCPRSNMVCRNMRLGLIGDTPSVLMGLCAHLTLHVVHMWNCVGLDRASGEPRQGDPSPCTPLHVDTGWEMTTLRRLLACLQAKAFFFLPLFFSQRIFPAADDRQRKKKEALGFERLKPWRLTRLGRLLRGQFSLPAHCSPFPMLLSALLTT